MIDLLNPFLSSSATAALLIFIASILYSLKKTCIHLQPISNDDDDDDDDDHISWKSATDDNEDEWMMLEADAKYAEELQAEEALLACMLAACRKTNFIMNDSLTLLFKNKYKKKEVCTICLERHEYWQMLRNSSSCSHSFCYDCITKHATTKIQDKNKTISCPGINCKSTLDDKTLRLLIPKEALVKWDELLCESVILESHKLYCPFANCSVLLINDDTKKSITKVDCPVCRRSFCAVCRVPWHSDFSCKEFGKMKDDDVAVAFAKKKKWMKCPDCGFFVEKVEGCKHITCRCKCQFCYDCGARWTVTHSRCTPAT